MNKKALSWVLRLLKRIEIISLKLVTEVNDTNVVAGGNVE